MISQLSNSKFLIPVMIAVAVLAAASGFYISLKQNQQARQINPGIDGLFWPNPKQLNEFSVLDQHGNPFSLEQIKGKWSLVFFGYTHCPDICPITMSVMSESYKMLAQQNKDTQTIFVSVDPGRDTTDKLLQYVNYFNPEFIGLGGDLNMIQGLTKQIGIAFYYNKEESNENYLVDHSASVFLIDPKGRLVGKLSPPHKKEQIVKQFITIRDFINAQS